MQITRQADYAVRAVLHLALLNSDQRATTKEIAKAQDIPASFLAKIVAQLSVVGILKTTRGVRGGVTLALHPEEITILDVVEAIDGPFLVNECVHEDFHCPLENCPVRDVWGQVQADLVNRLSSATFAQFLSPVLVNP